MKVYNKNNPNLQIQKKKGNCFNCGKTGHSAATCRMRGNFKNNNNNKGSTSNKANMVEIEKVIAAVVSEAHLVSRVKGWVVDSACTRHFGACKEEFTSYTPIVESTEFVYVGDNKLVLVSGKGKVLLKLSSSKILSLTNVSHIPHFRHNLISICKAGIKVLFDGGIFTLSKNEIFVGNAYLVDSIDVWHGRFRHINLGYINKMKECGIINSLSEANIDKCEICVETKITKKPCNL